MPKLPTVETFGPRPTPRAPRGVHAFRADIAQKAEVEGIRQVGEATSEMFEATQAALEKFAEEDATREVVSLDTAYSDGIRALQYGDDTDQNAGYLGLMGQAAIDGREAHIKAVEKFHETMMNRASSPRVRDRVAAAFNARFKSALDSSVRHFSRQRRVAQATTYEASQAATRDDAAVTGAAGDSEGVVSWAKVAGRKAAVRARQTGANPVLEAEAAVTGILISEIERLALVGPESARQFFEEHKGAIDGRQHNAIEVLLQRAERETDGEIRRVVVDAVAVLDRGRTPANLANVQAAAKGTKHEAPLAEAIEDRAEVTAFLRKPLAEQAAELQARPETTTRRALETEGRMQRAHMALRNQIKAGNGLSAAAELGVIGPVDPVNLSDPETLRRRALQARMASDHFGARVSPFLPSEADAIAEQIDVAPADQATGILAGLHDGLGREPAMSFVDQVAEKRPELALALVNVTERPLLAREIIAGGRLLKENKDVAPSKTDRQEAIAEVFGTEDRSVFTADTATALAPILDAGAALYAGRRVPTGDLTYDGDAYQTALREVVGGVIEFNGRNILAPIAGMSEDAFEDAMERLTQPDLIEFGNGVPLFSNGDPFTVDMFESSFFGPDAQLVTSGFGRYLVAFPGLGFVLNEAGAAYELDLAAFIRGRND